MNRRDKVRGCFLGLAVGDALGRPVEMWDAGRIKDKFGRIDRYVVNPDHKHYDGSPPGSWSDDTQLSLATARALASPTPFAVSRHDAGEIAAEHRRLMDEVAEEHCREYMNSTAGWGATTRVAVGRIVDGGSWESSGRFPPSEDKGYGNGTAMKAAPLALYMALSNPNCDDPLWAGQCRLVYDFAKMTHATEAGVVAAFVQTLAVLKCFNSQAFDAESFVNTIHAAAALGKKHFFTHEPFLRVYSRSDAGESFLEELAEVIPGTVHASVYTVRPGRPPLEIISRYRGGCSARESLPFTYSFFLNNPTLDGLYDVVSAGGDADTNGSMFGALLGALRGAKVFPKALLSGLQGVGDIIQLADQFYDRHAE